MKKGLAYFHKNGKGIVIVVCYGTGYVNIDKGIFAGLCIFDNTVLKQCGEFATNWEITQFKIIE